MDKILIAAYNAAFLLEFREKTVKNATISLCSSAKALQEKILWGRWDVLVLEWGLPGLDAPRLLYLMGLIMPRCQVIVLSSAQSDAFSRMMMDLRVAYVMTKPWHAETVCLRMADLLAAGGTKPAQPEIAAGVLLGSLGVPRRMVGFRYLRDSLTLLLREPDRKIDARLFGRIASQWGSSSAHVHRAIRQAITQAWENRQDGLWQLYFPPKPGKLPEKPNTEAFLFTLWGLLIQEGEGR